MENSNNLDSNKKKKIICSHCSDSNYCKSGFVSGEQRYNCKSCCRSFTMKPRRISKEKKYFSVLLYLNNVGVRRIARLLNIGPASVLRFIKAAEKDLKNKIIPLVQKEPDIIELDEIYTYVKKKTNRVAIWTAYSRRQKRIVAFSIGNEGLKCAKRIYEKAKSLVGKISCIYTDANSCYSQVFKSIEEQHIVTKSQTHLIESSNSSIRDNLARFNRRTKRFSKSLEMLKTTMNLFINRHLFDNKYELQIKLL